MKSSCNYNMVGQLFVKNVSTGAERTAILAREEERGLRRKKKTKHDPEGF